MKLNTLTLTALTLFTFLTTAAQIEGDNLFSQDQIVTIDLTFPEAGFYTTLTSNYATDDNPYITADLTLTDVTGTYSFDSVGVRLKGNSSYNHPGNKKSFKIDFNEFVSGQNYDGLKKLNFSNGFKDPSCIREKIFFDVCRDAGVPAPRANFANVTMNGTPWGFYTLIEQIDDQFLDWAILDDDGNLFKAGDNFGGGPGGGGDAADLVYYGAEQSAYADKYELKTNEDLNDWSDLIELIDFINNSSDEEFRTQLASKLELEQFLRSAALDNLFANLDSYTGSARNYYIYHNQMTNRWQWIKWDGNESFGSYANGVNNIPNMALDYAEADRPLLERIFDDAVLYDMYQAEVCDIVENLFNSAIMDEEIDAIYDLVQSSVYADNNKQYTNANFDAIIESNITGGGGGPGGGQTTYGLKPFIASRAAFALEAIDCSVFSSLEELELYDIRHYPDPAQDIVYVASSEQSLERIELVDMQGRSIRSIAVNGLGETAIAIDDLRAGAYILRYHMQDGASAVEHFVRD